MVRCVAPGVAERRAVQQLQSWRRDHWPKTPRASNTGRPVDRALLASCLPIRAARNQTRNALERSNHRLYASYTGAVMPGQLDNMPPVYEQQLPRDGPKWPKELVFSRLLSRLQWRSDSSETRVPRKLLHAVLASCNTAPVRLEPSDRIHFQHFQHKGIAHASLVYLDLEGFSFSAWKLKPSTVTQAALDAVRPRKHATGTWAVTLRLP